MPAARERLEKAIRGRLDELARQKPLRKAVLRLAAMLAGGLRGCLKEPWINGFFNFAAAPATALAAIATLASLGAGRETGQIFSRAVVCTMAVAAAALFVWAVPANIPAAGGAQNVPAGPGKLSCRDRFLSVFPGSILHPFASGNGKNSPITQKGLPFARQPVDFFGVPRQI